MPEDDDRKRRRITDVGWVGWTLIASVCAAIAAGSYNFGMANSAVQAMQEAMKEHMARCREFQTGLQNLAVMAQAAEIRISHLEREHQKR